MAKQGQHEGDSHDPRVSKGPNDPAKSVVITTGSYKKPETTVKQQYEDKDPHKQPQADRNEWNADTRKKPDNTGSTRARNPRSGRSGSDSNASRRSRGG